MQTPSINEHVVSEDYYHMTTINENMIWIKLIYLLSTFSLNFRAPFCTFNFTSKFLRAFLNANN